MFLLAMAYLQQHKSQHEQSKKLLVKHFFYPRRVLLLLSRRKVVEELLQSESLRAQKLNGECLRFSGKINE